MDTTRTEVRFSAAFTRLTFCASASSARAWNRSEEGEPDSSAAAPRCAAPVLGAAMRKDTVAPGLEGSV